MDDIAINDLMYHICILKHGSNLYFPCLDYAMFTQYASPFQFECNFVTLYMQ